MACIFAIGSLHRGWAGCCLIGTTLALALQASQPVAATGPDATARDATTLFLTRPRPVRPYTALRRLEASGGGRRAWLEARTEFSPSAGLRYEVTAEDGSGFIRSRVLRSLLDEEQRLIAEGRESSVALAPDNYEFTPEHVSDGLAVVALRPLRKERALVAGRMLLTLDGALRRIEGRLAKTPSFWVTRVDVVRTYESVEGVPMPVALETTARLRFFGSSQLRMTYRYLTIDDRQVGSGED